MRIRRCVDPLCVLLLAAAAGGAGAETLMAISRSGEAVSASASVRINVVVHPINSVRLSASGVQASGNLRQASTCELRYADGARPPAPSATLDGVPCLVRWVPAGNGQAHQPGGVLTSSQP